MFRLAYRITVLFVLLLAGGVLLLFLFLVLRRWVTTLVRAHAARREAALTPLVHAALGDPSRILALRVALRRFDHLVIRDMLLRLAFDLRGEEAARITRLYRDLGLLEADIAGLRSRSRRRRAAAAANLGTLRIPGTLGVLRSALADPDPRTRLAAARAVGNLGTREALAALVPLLEDPAPAVSRRAQSILADGGRKVGRELRTYLRESRSRTGRLATLELLGWLRMPEATRLLLDLAQEADPEVRIKATKAVAATGDPRALHTLQGLLADPLWEVRAQAAKGLGLLGTPESVSLLRGQLGDPHWWVRYHAAAALADLGPEGKAALEDAREGAEPRAQGIARYILERTASPIAAP